VIGAEERVRPDGRFGPVPEFRPARSDVS
jgi:hypothetical protein